MYIEEETYKKSVSGVFNIKFHKVYLLACSLFLILTLKLVHSSLAVGPKQKCEYLRFVNDIVI